MAKRPAGRPLEGAGMLSLKPPVFQSRNGPVGPRESLSVAPASSERVLQVVYRAIDEINPGLPPERRLKKSADTALFGHAGALDSLGLVNLIVAVEQAVEDELGASVTLADEKAMSQSASPFRTVGTLAEYVRRQLGEHGGRG
jgi:acyl carrier protein